MSLFDVAMRRAADPWFADLRDDGDPDGLAWFQREAVDAVFVQWEQHRSTMIVLATGLGKTQCAGAVINEIFKRNPRASVLFLAHRDELVTQARSRIEQMCGVYAGVEQSDSVSQRSDRVVIGSTQSVTQKRRLERLGHDRFDYVISDEHHRYMAPTFKRCLDWFSTAKVLGLTATPDRHDKKGLVGITDSVAYRFDILRGINAGYLVPVRMQPVELKEIDLRGVGTSKGDLNAGELDAVMLKAAEGIVHVLLTEYPDRKAIVFAAGVRCAEYMTHRMNERRPDSACFISAATPYLERQRIVSDFKKGKYRCLFNCQIATEGFDDPEVSLVGMGRPTLSRVLYAQMLGRGCRAPSAVFGVPGKEGAKERCDIILRSSKPDCICADFVGNCGKHTLVTPLDILGSEYTGPELARAKRAAKLDPGADVRKLLDDARKQLRDLAAQVKSASVKYSVREVDPFKLCGVEVSDDVRFGTRFGTTPASERQLNALRNLGVKNPEGTSKRAAKHMLDRLIDRRRKGYATLNQVNLLKKFGVDAPNVSKMRASEVIDYIIATKKKGGFIRSEVVNAMVNRPREIGEEG